MHMYSCLGDTKLSNHILSITVLSPVLFTIFKALHRGDSLINRSPKQMIGKLTECGIKKI